MVNNLNFLKKKHFAFNMETPEMTRRSTEENRDSLVGLCLPVPSAGLSVVGEAASTDTQDKT